MTIKDREYQNKKFKSKDMVVSKIENTVFYECIFKTASKKED